ncbi:MAG: DUF2158 domain-containing protein [Mangrovicoccus sp.]
MFETGDVVVLKSGGPHMTVKKVEDDAVRCVWFLNFGGSDAKPAGATFEFAMLKKVEEL